MLSKRVPWRMLAFVMFSFVLGCSAKPPPLPPPSPLPPPEPQWAWGQVPIGVGLFGDDTGIRVPLRTKKGAHFRHMLGRGASQQLTRMLEQSKAFSVIDLRAGQDEVETQDPPKESAAKTNGENTTASRSAQVEVSGILLGYVLSPASVANGVKDDPLLGELQADPAVESTFQQLAKRAEKTNEDKISLQLRLMDAQARSEINAIAFHCTPEDWESPLKGWFDDALRSAVSLPQTPIQRATRACLIKAVNWVGDQYDSWKKNPEQFPNYRKIQEDLNKLGYDCGAVDGRRGRKTEACIQKFLSDKGIVEKDLKSAVAQELELLTSPY